MELHRSVRRIIMAIQYSGNAQTSTFTPTTKQDIINAVGAALLAAGWTTISGGTGTTNWMLQSATTPQGFAINVRMKDNSGTCVTFSLESTDGVLVGGNSTTVGGGFLAPGSAQIFRIVCNKYQAFVFVQQPTPVKSYVGFGVPWVPSWVQSATTRIGWMEGNTTTDADTTLRASFRTVLYASSVAPATQVIYNTVLWSANASSGAAGSIASPPFVVASNNTLGGAKWVTGQALIYDALIGWGSASSTTAVSYMGQLWDAVISTDTYTGDLTTTFDSHNWIVLTDGGAASSTLHGCILAATS
jgi:hypothetical protein